MLYHKFDEKQAAYQAERQEKNNSRKRGRQLSETSHYGPSQDDAENDAVDRAVCKIAQAFNKCNASNNGGAPDEGPKSNANAGSSFDQPNDNEESEDEVPKAHPKATHYKFLSKLMQSSHLSDFTRSLHLVGQLSLLIAAKKQVRLYQVRLKVIITQKHGVLVPTLLWIHTRDRYMDGFNLRQTAFASS